MPVVSEKAIKFPGGLHGARFQAASGDFYGAFKTIGRIRLANANHLELEFFGYVISLIFMCDFTDRDGIYNLNKGL